MTRITCASVLDTVSAYYNMPLRSLLGSRRTREFVRPRHVAMWLVRKHCPHLSLPDIGRRMGGFDHTTIMNGVRNVDAWLVLDPEIRRDVEALERKIAKPSIEREPTFSDVCAAYAQIMRRAA